MYRRKRGNLPNFFPCPPWPPGAAEVFLDGRGSYDTLWQGRRLSTFTVRRGHPVKIRRACRGNSFGKSPRRYPRRDSHLQGNSLRRLDDPRYNGRNWKRRPCCHPTKPPLHAARGRLAFCGHFPGCRVEQSQIEIRFADDRQRIGPSDRCVRACRQHRAEQKRLPKTAHRAPPANGTKWVSAIYCS